MTGPRVPPPPVDGPSGYGWAKLILCGEHAVVYGHPGLALALDRGTRATITRRPGPTALAGGSPSDPRVNAGLAEILGVDGWAVHVRSDVPMGVGMGSSAALAVAVARARLAYEGAPATPERVFALAMQAERAFHGNPSGIDQTVADRGGMVRFRRPPSGAPLEITPLPPPPWRVVVLETGTAGNTRALVEAVAARRPAIDPLLDRIGALVDEAQRALRDPHTLGPLLDENQRLLEGIGVSTPGIEALVALARGAGAFGAKLAGAGGGGVVLAICDDPGPILAAADRAGARAFEARVAPVRGEEDRHA
jgi:mevalonate kinase